jgi:hypothetical protein
MAISAISFLHIINPTKTKQNKNMNEELQKKTVELIEWIQLTANTVTATAAQEVPLFIQEYLAWFFWSNVFWMCFGILLLLVGVVLTLTSFKRKVEFDGYGNPKETIDLCKKSIPLMIKVEKPKGSVESRVKYLQGLDNIYIHPECQRGTAEELISYQWKLDRFGEATMVPEKENDDIADAIGYAIQPKIGDNGPKFIFSGG